MLQADSENFCLKWNDFVDNVTSSFGQLRTDKDFSDVTLVSGDGHQIKAHRLALASGSLVFKGLLSQNSAANPVIFMRGVKSGELNSIVDFLYLGETNIHQDDLNEFLALAEDLQLKGLTENRKQVMETSKRPETERESVLTSFKEGRISTIGNARKKVSGENQMEKLKIVSWPVDKIRVTSYLWWNILYRRKLSNLASRSKMKRPLLRLK